MLRMMSFRTGQPSYEPAAVVNLDDEVPRRPQPSPDDGGRKRTVRRLMVTRLRVEITTREAAQPSDPGLRKHGRSFVR